MLHGTFNLTVNRDEHGMTLQVDNMTAFPVGEDDLVSLTQAGEVVTDLCLKAQDSMALIATMSTALTNPEGHACYVRWGQTATLHYIINNDTAEVIGIQP